MGYLSSLEAFIEVNIEAKLLLCLFFFVSSAFELDS
jgi:hypothetical protein